MVHAIDRCIAWYVDPRGGGGVFGGVIHVAALPSLLQACMRIADVMHVSERCRLTTRSRAEFVAYNGSTIP
jgi:hypothetical protein